MQHTADMNHRSTVMVVAAAALLATVAHARPQTGTFVTSAPSPPSPTEEHPITSTTASPDAKPIISQFLVRSDVQFRYARTRVESYVKNPASASQQVSFSIVMPEKAFVSRFSMLIGEEEFVAEVKEKAEAKKTFDEAVQSGHGAGIVDQDTRDANLITVTVNLEPNAKVRFALTYEELLERKLGRYEHVIHVNPGQIVNEDFKVEVFINESLPLGHVRVPKLKTDPNSITSFDQNPLAKIEKDAADPSKVKISYVADRAAQKKLSEDGINGQFIVQYDVAAHGEDGDIQILDGYFVHFFSPDQLETLPKHVVFVLDVSGSMSGTKLDQTKDAMVTVLDDLTDKDYFNIITFSDDYYHWVPGSEKAIEGPHSLAYQGTEENRDEALTYALDLKTIGGTNINSGMIAGIDTIKRVKYSEQLPANTRPIIIFLTDGEPTTGVTDPKKILSNVRSANAFIEVPIYGLAFGEGADFSLMKKMSLANNAFARKIYEGSDAAIQLEDFYAQIANPLLADVDFEYVGERVGNGSVTKANFDSFNKGNEIVISGKIDDNLLDADDDDKVEIVIKGKGISGDFEKKLLICLRPMPMPAPLPVPLPMPKAVSEDDISEDYEETSTVSAANILPGALPPHSPPFMPPFDDRCIRPPRPREPRSDHENFIERLWAFMSIKEYLDDKATPTQERRREINRNRPTTTTTAAPSTPLALPVEKEDDHVHELVASDEMIGPDLPLPPPKPKTNREKAIDLALKYNFVTPVTSLVVVRPDENATETVDPVPVSKATPQYENNFYMSRSTFSAGGYSRRGGASTMMAAGPPRRKMGSSAPRRRISGGRPGPIMARLPAPPPPPPPPTSPPPAPPRQSFAPAIAMMAYDMYDDDMYDDDYVSMRGGARFPTTTTTTTTPKTTCSGTVTLFSQTYRRGLDKVEISSAVGDVLDLADLDFDDKLKSLSVTGDCCWKIFADANHSGKSMTFRAGDYDSPSRLAKLVKKASSVQRLFQC